MTSESAHRCWCKSQRSGGTDCVEVTEGENGEILVRDSTDPHGPVLRFDRETWRSFLADVKRARFDLPAAQEGQRPSSGAPTVQ